MKRYKELVFNDKTYTEDHKINDILIKNGFEWFLDCEVENVRIEILKNTLVFNSGVFFNGTWEYGVFRDGQWKYGTWEGGVWYNGTWYNGIFKNGLIFDGRFINGKIEGGEIRGGEFFDVEIGKNVSKNIEHENKNSPKPQQGQPQNRGMEQKIQQGYIQEPQIQKVQPEKIEEMKINTTLFGFLFENLLYDKKNFILKQQDYNFKINIRIDKTSHFTHDSLNRKDDSRKSNIDIEEIIDDIEIALPKIINKLIYNNYKWENMKLSSNFWIHNTKTFLNIILTLEKELALDKNKNNEIILGIVTIMVKKDFTPNKEPTIKILI